LIRVIAVADELNRDAISGLHDRIYNPVVSRYSDPKAARSTLQLLASCRIGIPGQFSQHRKHCVSNGFRQARDIFLDRLEYLTVHATAEFPEGLIYRKRRLIGPSIADQVQRLVFGQRSSSVRNARPI
jgi:hypothetical protein